MTYHWMPLTGSEESEKRWEMVSPHLMLNDHSGLAVSNIVFIILKSAEYESESTQPDFALKIKYLVSQASGHVSCLSSAGLEQGFANLRGERLSCVRVCVLDDGEGQFVPTDQVPVYKAK